jgi:hypothetical protein
MIKRCLDFDLATGVALTEGFVFTILRKPGIAFETVGGFTGEVTGEVRRLQMVLIGEMKRTDIHGDSPTGRMRKAIEKEEEQKRKEREERRQERELRKKEREGRKARQRGG